MRRFNISAIFSAALLLAAVACTSENLMEKGGNFISLELSSRTLETKATMQGEDPLNENIINSVYYFFFKDGEESAAPVVKGRLIGLNHKSGVRTEDIPVASGTAASLFEGSDECRAFIVANPPKGLEEFLEGTPSLTELRTRLFQSSLDGIQESFTMIFDDRVAKTSATGNIMTVDANLGRLANKFTVSLTISATATGETEWTSVPADAKVEFHNAFKETALGGDFATVKAGDIDFKEKIFATESIGFGELEQNGDDWKCKIERPIYSYSISWEFVSNTEPYLIIELPWQNATSGEIQKTYYKVFFSTKDLTINNWCHLTVELKRLGGFHEDDPVQILDDMDYMVLDWNRAYEEGSGITTDIDNARYLMMNQTEYWLYSQDSWNFPYTSSHECEIVMEGPEKETYERMNYRKRDSEIVSGDSREMGLDKDGNPIYDCTLNGSLITFYHKLENDFSAIETDEESGINYGAYDVVPYTFRLTIRHKDNHAYKQEVTVHQYPAIYIEAQANTAGVKLEPGTGQQSTTYVHINPLLIKDGTPVFTDEEGNPIIDMKAGDTIHTYLYYGYGGDPQHNVDGGVGSMTIGNSNGNMYVITTTAAPIIDGRECMLADPRQFTSNVAELRKDFEEQGEIFSPGNINLTSHPSNFGDPGYPLTEKDEDIFEEASALYGTSPRTLTYYYPTKNTKEAENIIAPKLRVASSWGQTNMLSYDKALRRCAAYQEDGYPAGRWRVPTKAEVMYICKLSSDHVIPQLFGQFGNKGEKLDEAAYYWCSTGKVGVYKVEERDGTLLNAYDSPVYVYETEHEFEGIKSIAVRCVYDEWYWENRDYDNGTVATTKGRLPASLWDTPYWGDMPR